jgi:TolA-binding protein
MHKLVLIGLIAGTALTGPAVAQSNLEPRVDRLEREMKAVQRTVFPGGAGKYVAPDISAPDPTAAAPGIPASSPVADLDARVAELERQQRTLTGQVEQNSFRLRQVEDAFAAYKRTTDARLSALEQGAATPPVDAAPRPVVGAPAKPPVVATVPPKPAPSAPAPKPSADPDRAAKLAAIERPSTGDAGEDSYLYGYRLWEAKLYPEAEAALKDTVAKYPKHKRASYAQNLLGRAYLDEGRPSLASMAFYDSFKKFPDGDRAPDSLYFLGQSLMKLNKPADACKVYAELDASYGSKIGPDLKAKADRGRADAKCR